MKKTLFAMAAVVLAAAACAQPVAKTKAGASDPEPRNVPELMITKAGNKVTDVATWEKVRRPELLDIFLENEYGRRPVERPDTLTFETAEPDRLMMDGKAIRKRVRVSWKGPLAAQSFVFTAFIPVTAKERPAPGFILICNRPAAANIDPERVQKSEFWPAEEIVARGYAALAFWNGDVALDNAKSNCTQGVHACWAKERTSNSWGALSAWAWGASRVLDWVETEPKLDAKRAAAVGLSRNGKTALVAGAFDTRFALTISCCSGCSGAKLNHMQLWESENLKAIMVAKKWFCPNYKKYVGKDLTTQMPFDQHWLLALVAPRLLYVSSASEDAWAGQRGEFAALELASPVWRLYGKPGLIAHGFPKADVPLHDGHAAYHLRTGLHDITRYDWQCYMDFAEGKGW